MLILNFSHPLTKTHLEGIRQATGKDAPVHEYKVQFDPENPYAAQVVDMVEQVGLSPVEWQTEAILVNLPSHNAIAAVLLAELHGRMGYFPPVIRLKPVSAALPPQFDFAEVINLQALRDEARTRR